MLTNTTVNQPVSNASSVSYARTESLPYNSLLAAWNDLRSTNHTTPIYRSDNIRETRHPRGSCRLDNAGRRLVQPHLLHLHEACGDKEGDVLLLSVNVVDNRRTNIEVYASWPQGKTFRFVSRVAEGGRANTTNGTIPV